MTQKTLIIIILVAILSAVGIIATIQLSRYHEEQKVKAQIQAEHDEHMRKTCKGAKEVGINYAGCDKYEN